MFPVFMLLNNGRENVLNICSPRVNQNRYDATDCYTSYLCTDVSGNFATAYHTGEYTGEYLNCYFSSNWMLYD